mgnify:CR=1 FL=1
MKHSTTAVLSAVVLMLTTSCNKFSNVSEGMTISELKEIVGEPDSIRNDTFNEVWFYNTHVVSVVNDTVTMVRSKKEIREEVLQMQRQMEELNKRLNR